MAHACAKCETNVEDGVPFCKACGAPQIRVTGVEPQPVVVPTVQEPAADLPLSPDSLPRERASPIQWAHAIPCAALGGGFSILFLMLLSILGGGVAAASFVLLWLAVVAGGAGAAGLYYRRVRGALPTPGAGAQVGAASGGFSFLFFIVIVAAMVYLADDLQKVLTDNTSQFIDRGYDAEKIRQMLEILRNPAQLERGLFPLLVILVVGSALGGAWYAAWTRKRLRP